MTALSRRVLLSAVALTLLAGTTASGSGGSGHEAPAAAPATSPVAKSPAAVKPVQMGGKPEAAAPASKSDDAHGDADAKPAAKTPAKAPAAPTAKPAPATKSDESPTAEQALTWLEEGNARFIKNNAENPNSSTERVSEVASGQHPFASILSCADSRVPVERVFDRGVGDLFVIRVAGNVAGESETGTIEYGTGHLHTPLLVVMGHTSCGAVGAAASGAELHGAVAKLVSRIQPSVDQAKAQYPELKPDQIAPIAIRLNVMNTIENLITGSEEIRDLASAGKLEIVGAVYDLTSGRVQFLGEHPRQTALLSGKGEINTAKANAPASVNVPASNEHDAQADADSEKHGH
jgi:carbonic anhydrase